MDTEFPGVIYEELPEKYLKGYDQRQREYLRIKANVDDLKIIQIGITLSDE